VATRIGVVTYGRRVGPLYREIAESYGLASRLAGVATLDVTPQQTFSDPQVVRDAVVAAARKLVQHDSAEAVLLAGAAMATMAADLQPHIDVPLLDGVACAVALAEAHAGLKLPRARSGSVSGTGGREVRGVSPELAQLFAQRP
jgi:allantoin racemase